MGVHVMSDEAVVLLPDGRLLRRADLPAGNAAEWRSSQRTLVARAVLHGLVAAREVCDTHKLALGDLQRWMEAALRDAPQRPRITFL